MSCPPDIIVCLGNGDVNAASQAQQIAVDRHTQYHGLLNPSAEVVPGCWHTSIYDITLTELKDKLGANLCEIVVLDQPADCHQRLIDYNLTIDMAEALVPYCTVTFVNAQMSNPFRQILATNKSFCVMPFVGIHVSSTAIRHCCLQSPVSQTSTYQGFDQDPATVAIRQAMLDGQAVPQCKKCYEVEALGSISLRQDASLKWAYELDLRSEQDVIDHTRLINYEIVLGNKCNAMCRMCRPGASHLIDREYTQLAITDAAIGLKESDYLQQVDIQNVQRLHVAGGESTISEPFENFLQKCIGQRRTDFEIHVSTNCYAISNRFMRLIEPFPNMTFGISIDGFDAVNLYIRWPIQWQKFCDNIKKLTKNLSQEQYSFNTVVSIYNIARLYELYKWLDDHYPDAHCSMTFLTEPFHMVPWNFPDKTLVLDNLEKIKTLSRYQRHEIFRSKIDALINRMATCEIDHKVLSEFFAFNDRLDQSRGVKLADYIPELERGRV